MRPDLLLFFCHFCRFCYLCHFRLLHSCPAVLFVARGDGRFYTFCFGIDLVAGFRPWTTRSWAAKIDILTKFDLLFPPFGRLRCCVPALLPVKASDAPAFNRTSTRIAYG